MPEGATRDGWDGGGPDTKIARATGVASPKEGGKGLEEIEEADSCGFS